MFKYKTLVQNWDNYPIIKVKMPDGTTRKVRDLRNNQVGMIHEYGAMVYGNFDVLNVEKGVVTSKAWQPLSKRSTIHYKYLNKKHDIAIATRISQVLADNEMLVCYRTSTGRCDVWHDEGDDLLIMLQTDGVSTEDMTVV